jgi:hypothetical protein
VVLRSGNLARVASGRAKTFFVILILNIYTLSVEVYFSIDRSMKNGMKIKILLETRSTETGQRGKISLTRNR